MSVSPDLSLGKVLAKTDSTAYTAAGGDRFSHGQCTWYAWGRAFEKYKRKLVIPAPANGGDWFGKIVTDQHITKRSATAEPVTDSIASFAHGECGHVVYIEATRLGWVYFTEYNWDQSQNGKLQKISTNNFKTLHGCKLNGYIVIR
jgi:surface antigen